MERRKFVLDTLKSIPLILIAPNLLAYCAKKEDITNPNGKTVLIIGAGISGLAAAKKLKTNGTNVGGNSKIYIGPKNGKFIIKNGSKIYIDNKTLTNNVQYKKRKPKKNNTF